MHFGTPKIQFNFELFKFESLLIVFLVDFYQVREINN